MAAATQRIDVVIGAKDMFSSTMKRAESQFDNYGKSVVAMAAKVGGAFLAMGKAWDLMGAAARFDEQEQAFTNLAASHGANAKSIIANLKALSGQTVSTAAVIESAGNAMLLGIPAERMAGMMEIARASAKVTGQTVQEAFNDIATGIGRQSPMILDNLGITVKLGKAYDGYAASLGKSSKQLTDAEKKQAFLNAVMRSGREIVDRVGKSNLSAAQAQAMFVAKMEDFKIVAGKVIITITAALSGVAFAISKVFAQTLKTAATAFGKLDQLMGKLPFYEATPGILEFADAQGAAAKEADRLMKQSFDVATAIWKEKEAVEGLAKAKQETAIAAGGDVYGPDLDEFTEYLAKKKLAHDKWKLEMELSTSVGDVWAQHQIEIDNIAIKNQMLLEMAWAQGASETEIAQLNADAKKRIAEQEMQFKLNTTAQTMSNLSSIADGYFQLSGKKNKEAFKIMQATKIAETTVNTYSAAMGAYNAMASIPYIGPVLGIAAAGAAIATGMKQVQQIQRMKPGGSPGGGGSISAGGGGGGGGGVPSAGPPPGSLIGSDAEETGRMQQTVILNVKALDPSEVDWDKYSENIIDTINRAGKERDVKIELEAVAR